MAHRRSRFPLATRPAKKLNSLNWQLTQAASAAVGAGATQGFQFSTVGLQPTTLLRMRGEVIGFLDAVQSPGKLIAVNYGIILVPEGSGATVQFAPLSDANAPWLLYGTALLGYEEMVTDVVDVPVISGFRHSIDNKAMRIIRPDLEMQ